MKRVKFTIANSTPATNQYITNQSRVRTKVITIGLAVINYLSALKAKKVINPVPKAANIKHIPSPLMGGE
jgi:hypothetical protein